MNKPDSILNGDIRFLTRLCATVDASKNYTYFTSLSEVRATSFGSFTGPMPLRMRNNPLRQIHPSYKAEKSEAKTASLFSLYVCGCLANLIKAGAFFIPDGSARHVEEVIDIPNVVNLRFHPIGRVCGCLPTIQRFLGIALCLFFKSARH